jgi:Rrf2 family protein
MEVGGSTMILSKSADYGLRAMIFLARQPMTRLVALPEIATGMRMPPFLLSRILRHLVMSGLLQAVKGHHGGFSLARDAGEITALDIVSAIDGPYRMFDCNESGECGLAGDCGLISLFGRAERVLDAVFRSTSLAELAGTRSTATRIDQPACLISGWNLGKGL